MSSLRHFALLSALTLWSCGAPKGEPGKTPSPSPTHASEKHEHGGEGEITLSPEQIRIAGIASEAISSRDFKSSNKLPATIVGDPDREIKVSARVEGIVEQLNVRVGDTVEAGQVLAVISSPEVARMRSEYQTQSTSTRLARENLNRRLKLNRIGDTVRRPYEEAQREVSQARVQINAAQANLELNRSKLSRLEDLLKDGIASKQQTEEARAVYREALARLEQGKLEEQVALTHLAREQRLKDTGLLADNEAFQAEVDLRKAEQAQRVAAEVLSDLGADPARASGGLPLRTPRRGVVTARPRAQGEHVAAGDPVVTVLDSDHVWAWVDLPPELVTQVKLHSVVQVRVDAIRDRTFEGRLTFINPEVDPDTKKLRARLEMQNSSGLLRPNMFAQVTLPLGQLRRVLSLPAEAVMTIENKRVVYVQEEPGHFERRPVEVGETSKGWVEIKSGLKAGDLVVTRGALALQAEDLKASMGEGGHQH
ncbi:MAG: efflux RND transporter periplasmic adaptor subunit [Candidatus Eremiobacteraeota bacterium]|nr:efflux RND transporter periplasmic adaptor subunit [Candidatus Eremiobacteraeota bacterium]MCW5869401.1 efflux RND transporter periplasmic adaptor subunit [Candidatus Eremiobacteraeota bacterium]